MKTICFLSQYNFLSLFNAEKDFFSHSKTNKKYKISHNIYIKITFLSFCTNQETFFDHENESRHGSCIACLYDYSYFLKPLHETYLRKRSRIYHDERWWWTFLLRMNLYEKSSQNENYQKQYQISRENEVSE